jgi:hypothetical protein
MQTSAAATFQPTESLFAVYREPFFNTIGQKRKGLTIECADNHPRRDRVRSSRG